MDTIDTSMAEGTCVVVGTEKLVKEPAEGMEIISVVEQDVDASSQEWAAEKMGVGLAAGSATGRDTMYMYRSRLDRSVELLYKRCNSVPVG